MNDNELGEMRDKVIETHIIVKNMKDTLVELCGAQKENTNRIQELEKNQAILKTTLSAIAAAAAVVTTAVVNLVMHITGKVIK